MMIRQDHLTGSSLASQPVRERPIDCLGHPSGDLSLSGGITSSNSGFAAWVANSLHAVS